MRHLIPLAVLWAALASLLPSPVLARNPSGFGRAAQITAPSRGPSISRPGSFGGSAKVVIPSTSHNGTPNFTLNSGGRHPGNGPTGGTGGISFGIGGNRVVVGGRPYPPTVVVPVNPVYVPVRPAVVNVAPSVVTPMNVEVPTNILPAVQEPIPVIVTPQVNPLVSTGRQITVDEMNRARKFFQQRLIDWTNVVEKRLPPAEFDLPQLLALMVAKAVASAKQIEIVDALRRGDQETAERLWGIVLPGVPVPFRPLPAKLLLIRFRIIIERGYPPYPVFRELLVSLPPEVLREQACCGADDLLAQLEQEVQIYHAITGVPLDDAGSSEPPTGFGKPSHATGSPTPAAPVNVERPFTPTVSSLEGNVGGYGKRRIDATAGQPVPLPTGIVTIVYHPKLPERSVVVVNPQTVMIGTGGQGEFHIEQGYVAQALGYPLQDGTPLPVSPSKVVRSGILILNPTPAKVQFVIDERPVSLEPGYQHVLGVDRAKVVSFDQGDRRETVRYELKPGTYRFGIESEGLNLRAVTYEVAVSNAGNAEPFRYVVQGEQAALEPEAAKTHTSNYPLVISFDRGNGSATKQVRWEQKQGTLQVSINPQDNLWDLYEVGTSGDTERSVLKREANYVPAF